MAYSCLRLRTIVRHASLGHVFKDGGQTEKAGWGRAAVINTTEQGNLVASRASVVSVVGGSNPENRAFFGFLSEKCTFRQKRIKGGI